MRRTAVAILAAFLSTSCAAGRLAGYALFPDAPGVVDGERVPLAGLHAPVEVRRTPDGLWHIRAADEHDVMFVTGYLQARDRLAQMDLFRHLALGRVSELVGRVAFGDKSSVDTDRFNRFLDFGAQADRLIAATSADERAAGEAFVAGVNAFIAEGKLPLEHRLLGVDTIEPWTPRDSLAIYQMLMFGLSSNYNREIRRLVMACEAGIDATLRVWPADIDFGEAALPPEFLDPATYTPAPAVVPELRAALPALCSEGTATVDHPAAAALPTLAAWVADLQRGWSASNNWVIAGSRTASGKPLLSNDPHLPHMNPPIVWGVEQETPAFHAAGFLIPGVHRVVFGHNGYVAWGATTNHVDRQDLVVHRPRGDGYELDGTTAAFTVREERFRVHGEDEPVRVRVRYTVDGPLVNDIEAGLPGRIPLAALRMTGTGDARDIDAARGISYARDATSFAAAVRLMDGGCTNWVFADVYGNIGYESPCLLPIRDGYSGAFPVAGWLSKYHWRGLVPKDKMPHAFNPARGWIVTANARIVPPSRFFTAYNNDAAEPDRFERAVALLAEREAKLTPADAERAQMDVREYAWPGVRAMLEGPICGAAVNADEVQAERALCAWDGEMTSDSAAATIFVALTNALIDAALADDLPGGAGGATWRYVSGLPQFESDVAWLWRRPATDPVWDDVRTPAVETRDAQLAAAFRAAVAGLRDAYGDDLADWRWGDLHPFRVRHLFAGKDGLLGGLLNTDPIAGAGSPSTLFKNQFSRADRARMNAAIGPVVRFTVDLADPWAARYSLAGGEGGWPKTPYYGNLTSDWHAGRSRRLVPPADAEAARTTYLPNER